MDISIVLVTHNRWGLLENVITFLERYQEYYKEIVVVDNGSEEEPPQSLIEKSKVDLIRHPRNVGVSEGRNIGAVNASGDLLCFVDDDGYLDITKLAKLKAEFENNSELAVISFSVSNISYMPEPSEVDFEKDDSELSFEKSHTFLGGACLIKREAFINAGMYPPDFHYGTEERDLSVRLIASGYSIKGTDDVVLLHYHPQKTESSRIYHPYHYYRNTIRHYWRLYPVEYAMMESLLKIFSATLRGHRVKNGREYYMGLAAGLLSIPWTIWFDRDPVSRQAHSRQRELESATLISRIRSFVNRI